MKKLKIKTEMLRRNGPTVMSCYSGVVKNARL